MVYTHIFGVLSTLMSLGSRANYFNEVFRGRVKPHMFSWLIWGFISAIGFAAQVSQGAGAGAWSRGFGSATCFIIVVVAFTKGERHIKRSDWLTLIIALAAVPLWVATKTPVWSVIIVCIIDTLGCYPTIRKSWGKPYEEPVRSYMISGLGAAFSIMALEHFNLSTWLYPAVGACNNVMIVGVLMWRRYQLRAASP